MTCRPTESQAGWSLSKLEPDAAPHGCSLPERREGPEAAESRAKECEGTDLIQKPRLSFLRPGKLTSLPAMSLDSDSARDRHQMQSQMRMQTRCSPTCTRRIQTRDCVRHKLSAFFFFHASAPVSSPRPR